MYLSSKRFCCRRFWEMVSSNTLSWSLFVFGSVQGLLCMCWIWQTGSSPRHARLLQLASWWAPSTGLRSRTEQSRWCRWAHADKHLIKLKKHARFNGLAGFSFWQVVGHKEGLDVMERADPLFLLIGLPTIPVMLILGKMIRWEDYVLRLWRKYSNKLQILNSIFPGQRLIQACCLSACSLQNICAEKCSRKHCTGRECWSQKILLQSMRLISLHNIYLNTQAQPGEEKLLL